MIKLKQSHPYQIIINKAQPVRKHTDALTFHCINQNQKLPQRKLTNSNSNYLLLSNNKRQQLGNRYERTNMRSQQRYETKTTIRQPRQYVPLSRLSPSPSKFTNQQWEQRKQLQYLQSQAYGRYLQQICKNAGSNRQKVKKIKQIRSNNVYLANSKQQQKTITNSSKHNITYHQMLSQPNSLSNLSKITQKNNILIQDPFDAQITCLPYLQNSSAHQSKLRSNSSSKIKIYQSKQLKPSKENYDVKHTVRPSAQLANKLAKMSKKSKIIQQQNTNETLRFNQPQSIYNIDFKLQRPPPITPSNNKSLSRSKSQGKKFIVVTSTEKNIR